MRGAGEDAPILIRRSRSWHAVPPLPAEDEPAWPGVLPPPRAVPADPTALPLARFRGRRAILANGVTWIEGRIEAGGQSLRIARLLLEGEADEVLALAAELAATLPLLPSPHGLDEVALALAEGRPPRARRQGPASLAGAETSHAAFRAAVAHLLDVILAEAPGCRPGAGPRGVHQTRVALRRLRSLLRLFRPVLDGPAWREWDARLREVAQALGAARDWDVFLGGIGPGTLAALDGDARVKRLLGAAGRERDAAYAALDRFLASAEFRAAILQGMQLGLLQTPATPDPPLAPFAAGVLRKRWKRLRKAGAAMAELDATALHEMRLDAKRLRYAAEPFAALWPGRATRRFTRRLADLQEALGLANDATVAGQLARRLGGRGAGEFAIGAVTGFAAGRAEGSRIAALAGWKRLRKAGAFWKSPENHDL